MGVRSALPRQRETFQRDAILVGDCLEELAKLPSQSIDLVFADPPYNLQLSNELHRPDQSRVDGVDDAWDRFADFHSYDAFSRAWLAECQRVLKPTGALWVIGKLSQHLSRRLDPAGLGFWILNDVIWRKTKSDAELRWPRFANARDR